MQHTVSNNSMKDEMKQYAGNNTVALNDPKHSFVSVLLYCKVKTELFMLCYYCCRSTHTHTHIYIKFIAGRLADKQIIYIN